MPEIREEYLNRPVAITRNYSLTMEHIAKVSDMAERSGNTQAVIVRGAIDLAWVIDQAAEKMMISPDELQAEVVAWLQAKVNGHES